MAIADFIGAPAGMIVHSGSTPERTPATSSRVIASHGDRLYFMLGDVSGKGPVAALLMAQRTPSRGRYANVASV
jgi:hypothetical protein